MTRDRAADDIGVVMGAVHPDLTVTRLLHAVASAWRTGSRLAGDDEAHRWAAVCLTALDVADTCDHPQWVSPATTSAADRCR